MGYLGGYFGDVSGSVDATPPVIHVVSPAAYTSIQPTQIIRIQITDAGGLVATGIFVTFPNGIEDVVYDNDGYGTYYKGASNVRTAISNGQQFDCLRDGGWLGSPTFRFLVVDANGNVGVIG